MVMTIGLSLQVKAGRTDPKAALLLFIIPTKGIKITSSITNTRTLLETVAVFTDASAKENPLSLKLPTPGQLYSASKTSALTRRRVRTRTEVSP